MNDKERLENIKQGYLTYINTLEAFNNLNISEQQKKALEVCKHNAEAFIGIYIEDFEDNDNE